MSKVKPEHFVRLWLEAVDNGESIGWIANTLKVSDTHVHALAKALRRAGVELPPIRRKFVEVADIGRLNELIRKQFGS